MTLSPQDSSDEDSSNPFDEALQMAGGFGRFQILLVTFFLFTATLHYSSNHLSQIFILLPPENFACASLNQSGISYKCSSLEKTASHDSTEVTENFFVEHCEHGWTYEMGDWFPTIASEKGWVCANSWKQYATHTLFCSGSMLGYLMAGFLADKWGRRPTIAALASLAAIANVLPLVFSHDYAIMAARFVAGIGADTTCSTVFLLVMEYTIPSHRTTIGAFWATGWTVLGGLYPWYAKLVFDYRYLLITTSVISALIIVMCPFIPESASWLVSAGRHDEALKTLSRIASFNGRKGVSEVEFKTLLLSIDANNSSDTSSDDCSTTSTSSFWAETVALVTTPNLRKTTFLLFSSWFLICLCYHADTLGLGHLGLSNYLAYSLSAALELPINIFTITCLDSVGRRWPNVFFMAAAGTLAFTFAAVGDSVSTNITMTLAVLLIVSLAGAYNVTYQLATELFPTVVRGRGVLHSKVCGDFGNIIATLVAYLVEINKNALILLVGVLAFLCAILLFFLPETTHEPLPQTLEDGENFGLNQSLCYCPVFQRNTATHKRTSSMTNVSYTRGRPANSVQPQLTPKMKSKLPHAKRSSSKDRAKEHTDPIVISEQPKSYHVDGCFETC